MNKAHIFSLGMVFGGFLALVTTIITDYLLHSREDAFQAALTEYVDLTVRAEVLDNLHRELQPVLSDLEIFNQAATSILAASEGERLADAGLLRIGAVPNCQPQRSTVAVKTLEWSGSEVSNSDNASDWINSDENFGGIPITIEFRP